MRKGWCYTSRPALVVDQSPNDILLVGLQEVEPTAGASSCPPNRTKKPPPAACQRGLVVERIVDYI
jgi:hypothetical protein